jgi:hypothetical protein
MMENAFDSRRVGPMSPDVGVAPLAAAGVIAVAAAVAAYLARPARRSNVATEKRQSLTAYLRDHLSGADAAIHIVRRLVSTDEDTRDGHLFRHLLQEFEQERAVVRSLLIRLGASPQSPKRVAASVSGRLLSLAAGGGSGDLSRLRTLEALAIGIQGKRCLWRALQELGTAVSAGSESFAELEARALRQWESVEQRRRALATTVFPTLGIIDAPGSRPST